LKPVVADLKRLKDGCTPQQTQFVPRPHSDPLELVRPTGYGAEEFIIHPIKEMIRALNHLL